MAKRMHVYETVNVLEAWDTGKPIAAICGDVRTLSRAEHDKRVANETPVCADCARIASAHASTGQAAPIHKPMTADEMDRRFRPTPRYTYTLKFNTTPWVV